MRREGSIELRVARAAKLFREDRGAHRNDVERRAQIVADDREELLARDDHLARVRVRGRLVVQETERLLDRQVRVAALARQIPIGGAPLVLEQPPAGLALFFQGVLDVAALRLQGLVETRALVAERFVGVEPLVGEAGGDFSEALCDLRQVSRHSRVRLLGRRRGRDCGENRR